MKLGLLALLGLLYSGCALTPTKVAEHMDVVIEQCSGHKTAYQRTECVNKGRSKFLMENNYPHMDLIVLFNANTLSLAEKIDQGKLSKVDANVLAADLLQKITTEELRRNSESAYANAARAQTILGFGRLGADVGSGFDSNVLDVNVNCLGC